jgi:hypothetical protein
LAIELNQNDEVPLLRAIKSARCVLFLGAGFSREARDRSDLALPSGGALAAELWEWSGLQSRFGAYAGQELPRVYQIALNQKGERALSEFIASRLTAVTIPRWYDLIPQVYWHRIYTTNVDNVVEGVYKRAGSGALDVVDGLYERPRDRDQFLERIQYIKLNGDLRSGASRITFSTRAYARRASELDPWWDQFVRDYSQNVTVFIGTSLNEPLLNQAIEARGPRGAAAVEGRPGSFLISKPLDPTVALTLPEFNVTGLDATAEEFFDYLARSNVQAQERLDVLRHSAPTLAVYVETAKHDQRLGESAAAFLNVFDNVRLPDVPRNYSSLFHQGTEPAWLDIAAGLDAPREITQRILKSLEERLGIPGDQPILVLSGNRGTGKSTVLMRAAASLAANGVPTFFSRGERIEAIEKAVPFIAQLPHRSILFIDNADGIGGRGIALIETLKTVKNQPLLVLGVRSSALYYLEDMRFEEMPIGDLTNADIEGLIDVLIQHRSLGLLTDAGRERIRSEFTARADKVLLVALKEATLSLGFREILLREFRDIAIEEHRLLYLCAALVGGEEASLSRGQLIDCSILTPAETQSALVRELRGVVVKTNEAGERWSARHPLIALEIVSSIAPRPLLATAYKRLLSTLASDMNHRNRSGEPGRAFRLYKRLVNHADIYERFNRDIDEARGIFEAIQPRLTSDPHFWLQVGSLELEFGELAWAERHLTTALGLSPHDFLVRNAWADLKYAQAIAAPDLAGAVALRKEACGLLDELIVERGDDSNYPWHIKLTKSLQWIRIWEQDPRRRRADLEELRELAEDACAARPRSRELAEAKREVLREYMRLANSNANA